MADRIPDAISQAHLASLLQGRSSLPEVSFSKDHPSEMGFLLALLVHRSLDKGPTQAHLAHAVMCLVMTLQHHLSEDAAKAVSKVRGPMDTILPLFLTQLVSLTKHMEGLTDSLLDAMHHQHGFRFDGSVSDDFLTSIGISREEYEEFRQQSSPKS
jgi:hypothetical protein